MPVERAVLCEGAGGSDLPFGAADPIRLAIDGPGANVHFRIDDLRRSLFKPIPPEVLDLVRIAAYVYAADQAVARPDDAGGYDDAWRRRLFFRVPVLRPDAWAAPAVGAALASVLSFLSEDEYHFDFVPGRPDPQLPIAFDETPFAGLVEEVVLFSGGLDSLAGAVREAVVGRRRILLINHRPTPKVSRRHADLVRALAAHAGAAAPLHVHVRANKDRGLTADRTQRTRSFLFASLAAAFARMIGIDRVRFYENGVVGLNLPLSAQVVGSRATRTTHPRTLTGFATLFGELFGRPFAVENPFSWHTKADVVREVADAGCGPLVGLTSSCAGTAARSIRHPHCGVCSQCVDRRFAVLVVSPRVVDGADRGLGCPRGDSTVDATPTRKSYTDDFRRQAVAMVVTEQLPLAEVARRLGMNPEVLRKWKVKYAPAAPADRPAPPLADEVRRLKEQVRQLTMEREILKKAATFFAKEAM